jgi:hypothetical protein
MLCDWCALFVGYNVASTQQTSYGVFPALILEEDLMQVRLLALFQA